jgi:thiamine-phosphate pyrophosphorylase
MKELKGLYIITDEHLTPYENIEYYLTPPLEMGANIVQLRDKTHRAEELIDIAQRIQKLCKIYKSIFIINDNLELAKAVNADGIHIGKSDMPIKEVKKHLPHKIIGVSCYNDIRRAERMEKQGASYVAFGSFFPSPTKPQSPVIEKTILGQAKNLLSVPLCAIGGITAENAQELIDSGADMIAVIDDLFGHGDVEKRVLRYKKLWEKAGSVPLQLI